MTQFLPVNLFPPIQPPPPSPMRIEAIVPPNGAILTRAEKNKLICNFFKNFFNKGLVKAARSSVGRSGPVA